MEKHLQGKVAVITGGNSGVGAATALLFAKEGASVVISARRQSALEEVAEKIRRSDCVAGLLRFRHLQFRHPVPI